jgi:acid phosphatase type 7
MGKPRILLIFVLTALALIPVVNLYDLWFVPPKVKQILLVSPYVQIGNDKYHKSASVLWQTTDVNRVWTLQYKAEGKDWTRAHITFKRALPELIIPSRLYVARLNNLIPGQQFQYRLLDSHKITFEGTSKIPAENTNNYRFVVFGDAGNGSPSQKKIAYRTYLSKPDFVVITGDIVYTHGRLSEYREKFFPVYNNETPSLETGAPLIRSVPIIPAPGNHDLDLAHSTLSRNLDFFPDGLAYFAVWDLPLNGPIKNQGAPNTPMLIGSPKKQSVFIAEAGEKYPVMANYSFDWGNSHWLILDANNYMNWADPGLRAWVEQDLKSTKALWKFVAYHQPGFSSDRHHFYDQRIRLLADVFEKCGVDVSFAGHVHNYQRTYPLKFTVSKNLTNVFPNPFHGAVTGTALCDKQFQDNNPMLIAKPNGVIYLVTGGGGANLSGGPIAANPKRWQNFTKVFIANTHSFTNCEINGRQLIVKQISEDGAEIDRFVLNK